MRVKQVLSRWLEQRSVIGHAKRAEALIKVVQALVLGGKAALTQLGRFSAGSAHVSIISRPSTDSLKRALAR